MKRQTFDRFIESSDVERWDNFFSQWNSVLWKDADICVFDLNKPWAVDKSKLKSKSKNTSIEDRKLQGQVIKTFVKGELSYESI